MSLRVRKFALRSAAVALAGVSKVGIAGPAKPAGAQVFDRRYAELQEFWGDRGVAAQFTAPSSVNCGGGQVFWDHIQQMVGNHGDNVVREWMETGVTYCRYGGPTVVVASCFEVTPGAGCQYSETPVANPAPPAPGAKMTFKINNTSNNASWETWESSAGGTTIGIRRDFTPAGSFGGNWSQIGLEAINMVSGGGSHANGLMEGAQYKDQAGSAWHAYGSNTHCLAQPPMNGSPFFGAPDAFIYNFAGGAGTCPAS